MHRFYCPLQNIAGTTINLCDKEQLHHLKNVLRLKINDAVTVFDEKGNEYICAIRELLNKQVILEVKDKRLVKAQKIKITVACAMPKHSKMDDIVDKLAQLGAQRIIPLETERSIVKLDKHKKILRLKRWEKIALSAAKQSQRNTVPVIEPIQNIKEVLSRHKDDDLKLIPTLRGKRKTLKEIIDAAEPKEILIFIGPEGDFTAEEVNLAVKAGCIPLSLGELVLRVETAAIAVVSFIKLYENS